MPLYTAEQLKAFIGGGADIGVYELAEKLVEMFTFTSAWNGSNPLKLGAYTFWVDATGDLRVVSGTPSSDTDGTVVGSQS